MMEEKRKRRKMRRSNLEDVSETIKQIGEEKSKRNHTALTVIKWVFFPITAVVLLIRYIFSTQKVRLTTKTTVIFTVLYGLLIAGYITFALLFFRDYLDNHGVERGDFFISMIITSVVLGAVFVVVGAAAGAIISNAMLRPIRKITTEIDRIDGENLSLRLKPLDSQDEIMELVDQINLMLDSLEESFERQSNFVSDASHELKTPLSVISGYGDLLNRWGKDDALVLNEGIAAIRREASYMAKIIDQMLLLARLGRFTMHKQHFDVSDMAMQIVDSYNVINSEYNLNFYGAEEVEADCDKTLLTEAIRALIDNAIKYTPKGGSITVSVAEDDGYAQIRIKDTGIGIDEEDLPYIFDRFYRCDKTRGREKGSAGLGLTICKNIIEMMDGEITVKSVRGEGTEFLITL